MREPFFDQEIGDLEEIAESIRDANKEDPSREKAIAITKIEEAIMWLEKANEQA